MCQSNYFQNECCSITTGRAVMCDLNLVKVQCVTVKLLIIFIININKKCAKAILFQNQCCSITSRRAVMCALNLVKVQCVSVKLLSMLLVTFFAFGTLQTVPQDLSLRRQRIEINVFYTERRKRFEETSLQLVFYITRKKRGVICVLKTFCSRVIDPEKSNLSISCQLYRTPIF